MTATSNTIVHGRYHDLRIPHDSHDSLLREYVKVLRKRFLEERQPATYGGYAISHNYSRHGIPGLQVITCKGRRLRLCLNGEYTGHNFHLDNMDDYARLYVVLGEYADQLGYRGY